MTWVEKSKKYGLDVYYFLRFVYRHFMENEDLFRASALTFASLLAIVPLMTVGLAILSSFPVFSGMSASVQNFIFDNFVPATGKIIQEYLQQFTKQVSQLSLWGILFLFVTALLVMYTIESSMNKIWQVKTPRRGVAAFLLYWAILSLSPAFLGLSLAAGSYLISMPLLQKGYSFDWFYRYIPCVLSFVGFTFLYVVVPNCYVRIRHGIWGALVATLLFELAKQLFAYYLAQYDTYQLLYGAFASLPIFFVWIYWVWFITLLGAEISYAFSVRHERRQGTPLDGFSHALLWLYCLWRAQNEGRGVSLKELVDSSSRPFEVGVGDMLNQFINLQWVQQTVDGDYVLSRDLTHVSLYDLTQALPYPIAAGDSLAFENLPFAKTWSERLTGADKALHQVLNCSLEGVFEGASPNVR